MGYCGGEELYVITVCVRCDEGERLGAVRPHLDHNFRSPSFSYRICFGHIKTPS